MEIILDGVTCTCENLGGKNTITKLSKEEHVLLWAAVFETDNRQLAHAYLEPVALAIGINAIFNSHDPAAANWRDFIRIIFVNLCTETAIHRYLQRAEEPHRTRVADYYLSMLDGNEVKNLGLDLEFIPCVSYHSRNESCYKMMHMSDTYHDPNIYNAIK